jgi:dTDP-4-amino-4,6-dideoxygalactose transaminase
MLPFSPPRIDDRILNAVTETLKSGWITTGPKTKLFEQKLTGYCSNKATLCVNSASSGLELMLRWFGVKEGDEVILPAYTYCATANVIVHCGAKPVFVDINDDYNISVNAVEKAITTKTKVIMPVDIAGFPCDYDDINKLVKRIDIIEKFISNTIEQKKLGRILIISDAAHSLGAKYKNKKTGSLTDITVFSFHAVKNLTTGEGGAICLNLPEPFDNVEIYNNLCIKSLHGQTKDAYSKFNIQHSESSEIVDLKSKIVNQSWRYDVVEAGYKYNMMDIQAAMGLVELERYDSDMLERRKHIFNLYSELFQNYLWFQPPVYINKDKESSYHVFLLRIKNINEENRDKIIDMIFRKEVSVNVHFIPVPMLTYYANEGYNIKHYPESYKNFSRTISLPVYYDLTDEQIHTVVKAVSSSINCID